MTIAVALICFVFLQLLLTFLYLRAPDPYQASPWLEESGSNPGD